MPLYRIETMTRVRRVYLATADNAKAAEEYVVENGADCLIHEEDESEETYSVTEALDKPPVTGKTPSSIL